MKTNAHFTPQSSNAKTGPVASTTISSDSCPDSCALKYRRDSRGEIELDANGKPRRGPCYAQHGPIALHWAHVDSGSRGGNYRETLDKLRTVPRKRVIRHKVAGDDPHDNGEVIESDYLYKVECTGSNPHIDYTHHDITPHNLAVWAMGKARGYVQNLSADSLDDSDTKYDTGFPVTVVLPTNAPKVSYTPRGRKIVACPAETANIQCIDCKLCASERPYIIGFRAHGTMKKSLSQKLAA